MLLASSARTRRPAARVLAPAALAVLTGLLGVGSVPAASAAPAPAATVAAHTGSTGAAAHIRSDVRGVPSVIRATGDRLYPEGVAWDPTRRSLLVGSARIGGVWTVAADGGTRPLVTDRSVVSTVGLTMDAARGRLLVTYADYGFSERSTPETTQKQSGLLIADLATGRVLHKVDLAVGPGPHGANDVTVDDRGNAWVTDTLQSAVYRVDVRGRVRAVVTDPRFATEGFGLNGIAWHPAGFVLTSRYDTGELFRIGRDGTVDQVAVDRLPVGADGIALRPDGSLVVATNILGGTASDALHVLRSTSRAPWRAAREVSSQTWPDTAPTTLAVTPRGTYAVSGRLDLLLAGDASEDTFVLRRATL